MLRTFNHAVAIVTGGASGIGRALAEALAARGASVLLADRQIDLARDVASRIRDAGGLAEAAETDVTQFESVRDVVQATFTQHGRLDYLFNNAGIGIGGEAKLYALDDWNRMIDVNLRGVTNGVQAAYGLVIGQGFGHIINTASMAGLMPAPGTVSYAATKYAVVGLSLSLRVEAARLGVRVSALCPGVVRTPILEGGGCYGKMLVSIPPELQRSYWESLRPMNPARFAAKVLRAVARNKPIIIVPGWWKLLWWANRLSPRLGLYASHKLFVWAMRKLERDGVVLTPARRLPNQGSMAAPD